MNNLLNELLDLPIEERLLIIEQLLDAQQEAQTGLTHRRVSHHFPGADGPASSHLRHL